MSDSDDSLERNTRQRLPMKKLDDLRKDKRDKRDKHRDRDRDHSRRDDGHRRDRDREHRDRGHRHDDDGRRSRDDRRDTERSRRDKGGKEEPHKSRHRKEGSPQPDPRSRDKHGRGRSTSSDRVSPKREEVDPRAKSLADQVMRVIRSALRDHWVQESKENEELEQRMERAAKQAAADAAAEAAAEIAAAAEAEDAAAQGGDAWVSVDPAEAAGVSKPSVSGADAFTFEPDADADAVVSEPAAPAENSPVGEEPLAAQPSATAPDSDDDGEHDNDDDDDDDSDDDDGAAGLNALLQFAKQAGKSSGPPAEDKTATTSTALTIVGDGGDEDDFNDAAPKDATGVGKAVRPKMLRAVNHAAMNYAPLRKEFFIPPPEVAKLEDDEVKQIHRELDGAKLIGANPPPPIRTWTGIGLNDEAMEALADSRFDAPFAIQSLAIPVLMSGRDLLAIAKTGSGKTLAYLLPLLRHVHYQPRARRGDGPIGVILTPTHELANQVVTVVERLCRVMGLKVVRAYGGTSMSACIGGCKGGCDVIVATPGRLFDLLVANRGRVANLHRCSFVVLDEADRMLDEGFSQHVEAFIGQTRPDRQVAMVSSTMPREVRSMAKRLLAKDFIELSVGGKASPSTNVRQSIEFFDVPNADDATKGPSGGIAQILREVNREASSSAAALGPKTIRLLQILGEEHRDADGNDRLIMVFVANRDRCDQLYVQLCDRGYGSKVATLYSGMDQEDREHVLSCFEQRKKSIVIATNVAERGIDVPDLQLVVNYDMPDHYESYVNRVGRTGRAGRKGRSITFLMRNTADEAMANDLVRALDLSGNDVPEELRAMAKQVEEKMKKGVLRVASNYRRGYGRSKAHTFTNADREKDDREAKMEELGVEERDPADDVLDFDSDDETSRKRRDPKIEEVVVDADEPEDVTAMGALETDGDAVEAVPVTRSRNTAARTMPERLAQALKTAETINKNAATDAEEGGGRRRRMYAARYDINDMGERLRKRLTSRKYLEEIEHETETTITAKGKFQDRKHVYPGEETLHLDILGRDPANIVRVFRKFDEVIDEVTAHAARGPLVAPAK